MVDAIAVGGELVADLTEFLLDDDKRLRWSLPELIRSTATAEYTRP